LREIPAVAAYAWRPAMRKTFGLGALSSGANGDLCPTSKLTAQRIASVFCPERDAGARESQGQLWAPELRAHHFRAYGRVARKLPVAPAVLISREFAHKWSFAKGLVPGR
jgi:hypothetical protein